MKEVNDMKKNVIALALIIVMLFSLSACGSKDETPAATEAPGQSASVSDLPAATPGAPAVPESGVTTYVSEVNGISFDYDVQYVAMTNQAGNAMIYAGESTDLPFCTVSLIPMTDAESYLKEMADASEIELGKDLTPPRSTSVTGISIISTTPIRISMPAAPSPAHTTPRTSRTAALLSIIPPRLRIRPMLSTAYSGSRLRLSTSPPTARTCKRLYY